MDTTSTALGRYFGVIVRGQTYLNLVYLALAFPLGLFYFVFLVTGLSVGFPLIILWVGLVILAGVFTLWLAFIAFERWLAMTLLRVSIPPMIQRDLTGKTLWQKFTAVLGSPVTWKGLLYLLARFPLGILSFVLLVTFGTLSVVLIGAPFYYDVFAPQVILNLRGTAWVIDTLPEALALSAFGILLVLPISLHLCNGLAMLSGQFARVMLGDFSTPAAVPAAAPIPPVAPVAPI